ncbi:Glycosidase [Hahella chejuensis KCTC 2396]|uniref:Glycosidase n=1 Tax=Hahella chejuensis (strain KCTC 2396) TaxID=349521 RepID=Q2S8C3_HAHCH|nr:alpha-amylase family glycosyl hydrolase [Hahella chejuensis]ABC33101.1 Glycosidase [Hahella chejuensis KCTC 2396]
MAESYALQGRTQRSDWSDGGVIYQIYPRSFCDSNGDGVGDLNGITEKLDYIASLGVDAVWISPFFKSPMKDFGYDVADYCDVDPIFGTLADFDRMLAAMHERGLKLLIDLVPCHTSDEHPWFQESRSDRSNAKADWYVWRDPKPDGSPPNNWRAHFGGPSWTWDGRRAQYYLHHFLPGQPNLNYRNPAVTEAMLAQAEFWFKRGVDGLRIDAIATLAYDPELTDNPARDLDDPFRQSAAARANPFHLQHHRHSFNQHDEVVTFLTRLRALADRYDGRFLLGEVGGDGMAVSAQYTAGEDRLQSCYNFSLLGAPISGRVVKDIVAAVLAEVGPGKLTFAVGNHDVMRVTSRWAAEATPAQQKTLAKTALTLLMTLPGKACVYQGEELGLTQADLPYELLQDPEGINGWPHAKGRDGCRTPMPWRDDAPCGGFSAGQSWLPLPDEHLAAAANRQEDEADSVLRYARQALALRKARAELRRGRAELLNAPDELFGILRAEGETQVLGIFNLSPQAQTFALPGNRWSEPLLPSDAVISNGEVMLPAFSCCLLENAK